MIHTLDFNGKDNYVLIGDAARAKTLAPKVFTVEALVKQPEHQVWTSFIGIMEDKGETEKGWMLGVTFGRKCSFALASTQGSPKGFTYIKDDNEFPVGKWRHIAGVYDGQNGNMLFYIDGELIGSSKARSGDILYPEDGQLMIGAFKDQDEFYPFTGNIAEVRLWNKVRTKEEIKANINRRLEPNEREGMVGYWPLIGGGDKAANWMDSDKPGEIKGATINWLNDPALTLGGFSPAPPAPGLLEAADIIDTGFTAKWKQVEKAERYYIDVATDKNYNSFVKGFENKEIPAAKDKVCSISVNGLQELTPYYYRLRSENDKGTSPNSNIGSITTPERSIPPGNYCLELNGEKDYLDVCDANTIKALFRQAFTAEIWIKPEKIQEKGGYIGVIEDEIEQQGWLLGSRKGKFSFAVSTQGRMDSISKSELTYLKTEKDHAPGVWYHLAGVYTGTKMQLFVNGKLEASSEVQSGDINYPVTDPDNPKQGKFVIGLYQDSQEFIPFKGKIAEARLWNKMRSGEEIEKAMLWRINPEEHPELVGCWRCDESAGTVAKDCAKDNNGTIKGDKVEWIDADVLSLFRPLVDIKQIAAGPCHTIALAKDGTVWAWGQNDFGQLGDGSTNARVAPVQVKTKDKSYLSDVEEVAAGKYFSLARTKENKVLAWGSNFYGQLGNESNEDSFAPVEVSGLAKVASISAYNNHAMALTEDASVFTWGRNNKGQLGNGATATETKSPKVALGFGGDDFANLANATNLGLKDSDFTVEAWVNGNDYSGTDTILGTDGKIDSQTLCLGVKDKKPHLGFLNNDLTSKTGLRINIWQHIAWRYTKATKEMAIFIDGKLDISEKGHEPFQGSGKLFIGRSQSGNYFNGNISDLRIWNTSRSEYEIKSHIQRRMSGKETELSGYWKLDEGKGTTINDSAGDLKGTISGASWKTPQGLLLYDGQSNNVPTKTTIKGASDPVVAIAAGGDHSVVMTKAGKKTRVFAWGDNSFGQIGNNSTTASNIPVNVVRDTDGSDFPYAKGVAAGFYHTVMHSLSNDHVYACGANKDALLGYDEKQNTKLPVRIKDGGDFVIWGNETGIDRIGIGPKNEKLRLAAARQVPVSKVGDVAESDKQGKIRYNPESYITEYCDGSKWVKLVKPFPGVPGDIEGAKKLFYTAVAAYSVKETPGASKYEWTVTVATITAGQGSKSISIKSSNNASTVSVRAVNDSGKSCERSIPVNIKSMLTKTFGYSGRIDTWKVPGVGLIRIEVWGAGGGRGYLTSTHRTNGGNGARMRGDFSVKPGDKLKILVGGQGGRSKNNYYHGPGAGGGGTFVVKINPDSTHQMKVGDKAKVTPLIIAGGGGGGGQGEYNQHYNGGHGRTAESGESQINQSGGANGNGGGGNSHGGGGAGFKGDGTNPSGVRKPQSFLNGGLGGTYNNWALSDGGFGGGGGAGLIPGGGGGYSGGASGGTWNSNGRSGGGGSYNKGANQSNSSGANSGHGSVKIYY